MSPLGFGTTNTRAPASSSGFAPGPGVSPPTTSGYSVMPTSATTAGSRRSIFASSSRLPRASSVRRSSAALRVGRAARFVSA
ncbi:MAG TPA: hypothetical protein VLT45_04755 [Kofleriaceae bacterium]|nr:hypothetical protein [Kofleriaceae bacterium]